MNFLKKNKIIVGVIVVIIIVLGIGAWYLLPKGGSNTDTTSSNQLSNVKSIKPEDIGLSLSENSDGKSIDMAITKLTGIKTIEYELSYDAEETDPESGDTSIVPKGVLSDKPIDVGGQSSIKRSILLGTCSSNVCRYDKVKSDIKVNIKVTYKNGEVASVELTVPYSGASKSGASSQ